jgi:hypothetical protein
MAIESRYMLWLTGASARRELDGVGLSADLAMIVCRMRAWWKKRGESVWRWLAVRGNAKNMPGWVYLTQVLWAVGLLCVFLAYIHGSDRLDLPHAFGRVPVEAPWLGAVGGLLASLGGIVRYNYGDWNPRFNYWHPIKPLMGAASGAVACLLVIVLARTVTGSASIRIDPTALDGAAFVFGYAESAFRALIKSVTDVFLRPGVPASSSSKQAGRTASGAADASGGGTPARPSVAPVSGDPAGGSPSPGVLPQPASPFPQTPPPA